MVTTAATITSVCFYMYVGLLLASTLCQDGDADTGEGQFQVVPENVTVHVGDEAVFRCEPVSSPFILWNVNGTLYRNLTNAVRQDFHRSTYELTILAKAMYNMTDIQCILRLPDAESDVVYIIMEGPPPTIGNLSIEYEYANNHYEIEISWTPPFSLLNNLSYDVTISTRNDTFTTRLLDPYYTFEVSDDKFCDSLEISVTAMNPAGEGDNVTKIAVGLYFEPPPAVNADGLNWSYMILGPKERMITMTFLEYHCPKVRAQLHLKSKRCGNFTSRFVVVNSTAAFTFSKTEVGDNCCFNASITTKNMAGSRSSNNTSICTFEVQIQCRDDTGLTCSGNFTQGSLATGVVMTVEREFQTYLYIVGRRVNTFSVDLYHDNVARIHVYKLEQNGLPLNGSLPLYEWPDVHLPVPPGQARTKPKETSAGNDYDFTLSADNAELIVTCPLEYTNFTGCAVICRYNNDNRLQTFAFSKGIGFPQYIHLPPGSYGCGVVGFISGQAVHSIVLLRPYTLNDSVGRNLTDVTYVLVLVPFIILCGVAIRTGIVYRKKRRNQRFDFVGRHETDHLLHGQATLPPEESAIRLPPEESAIRLPPEESTIPLPPEESAIRLPPEESAIHLPPEESTIPLPPEGSTIPLPPEGSTIDSPPEGSTIDPPPEGSTIDPPPEESTIDPPPEGSTIDPPPEESTIDPPPEVSTIDPPPEGSTIDPPPEVSTIDPPPERSTIDPPPEGSTIDPPPEGSTIDPPPEGSTIDPPPEGSTIDPPPEVSTIDPPPEGSTIDPPPEEPTVPPQQTPYEPPMMAPEIKEVVEKQSHEEESQVEDETTLTMKFSFQRDVNATTEGVHDSSQGTSQQCGAIRPSFPNASKISQGVVGLSPSEVNPKETDGSSSMVCGPERKQRQGAHMRGKEDRTEESTEETSQTFETVLAEEEQHITNAQGSVQSMWSEVIKEKDMPSDENLPRQHEDPPVTSGERRDTATHRR